MLSNLGPQCSIDSMWSVLRNAIPWDSTYLSIFSWRRDVSENIIPSGRAILTVLNSIPPALENTLCFS